jgi:hypothetical protein
MTETRGQIDQGREFMWGAVGLHQLAAPPDGRISEAPFIWRDLPKGGIPEVVRRLKADARAVLGPGQPFEIRRAIPRMYGKGHGLAWVNGHHWHTVVGPVGDVFGDGQEVRGTGLGYYLVEQCWTDP